MCQTTHFRLKIIDQQIVGTQHDGQIGVGLLPVGQLNWTH
jgi:hypothetical protein